MACFTTPKALPCKFSQPLWDGACAEIAAWLLLLLLCCRCLMVLLVNSLHTSNLFSTEYSLMQIWAVVWQYVRSQLIYHVIFKWEFCLTFLNICSTDQQMPKLINVIRDIAFSHTAISKGFPSTPGIVTWHKISKHICLNCTPHNGSIITLRLVPSSSSILQSGFHKLHLSGFISHTSKLKKSVNRFYKVPKTLTIMLTQENLRRW